MEQDSLAVVKGIYDSFSRGDVPAALGALADDIEWHEAEGLPWGGLQRGPGAVAENVFGPSNGMIDDFAVKPEKMFASGDTVAVQHRYVGTGKATGAKLDILGAGFWEVSDGKVVRYRQFVDTVKFREVVSADATSQS